jgi:hypothetical protein
MFRNNTIPQLEELAKYSLDIKYNQIVEGYPIMVHCFGHCIVDQYLNSSIIKMMAVIN